jgi:hypothetical protein
MRAPTPPDSPAIIAATLAALLARHGLLHIYTAAVRNRAVVSVGPGLTAWTDGRQLWCTRNGHRETWPATDTSAAAARLAALARQGQSAQVIGGMHAGGTPERKDDVSDGAAASGQAAMTADGSGDPIAVDRARALDALTLAWADQYDKIRFHPGAGWGAHRKDAPGDDVITGSTPDELNRNIRADWQRREGQR